MWSTYERITQLLVEHVRVEHNGGGCPLHLFSNSNCFLRFPIPPEVSTLQCITFHRAAHYITMHYILFLLCRPLCIHCATYYITIHYILSLRFHCIASYREGQSKSSNDILMSHGLIAPGLLSATALNGLCLGPKKPP